MNRDEIKKKIPMLLSGELSTEEARQLREFIQQDPELQKELKAYEASWAMLDEWEDVEPDPGYMARFWTKASEQRSWVAEVGEFFKTIIWQRRLSPLYTTVFLIVLIALVTFRTSIRVSPEAQLAKLSPEEMELYDNMELVENLEVIEDIEFLEDLELFDDLDHSKTEKRLWDFVSSHLS